VLSLLSSCGRICAVLTKILSSVFLSVLPTVTGSIAPRYASFRISYCLLTGELAWHIVLVSALFLAGVFGMFAYAMDRGYSVELARTIAVNTLVVMESFHLFFIRNIYGTSLTWSAVKGTRVVWLTVIAVTLAQFAMTYLPPLQRVFGTESVPLFDGVLIIGVGVALFAVIETEKQLRLRMRAMSCTASGEGAVEAR
jgi:magnesium-transporting ATPase (P-type)